MASDLFFYTIHIIWRYGKFGVAICFSFGDTYFRIHGGAVSAPELGAGRGLCNPRPNNLQSLVILVNQKLFPGHFCHFI